MDDDATRLDPDPGDLRARLRAYFFAVRLTRRGLLPVVLVLAFLGVFLTVHALAPTTRDGRLHPLALLLAGAKVGPLIRDGEWWRVPASLFLHADPLHLAVNCVGAFFLAQLAENVFGTSRAVLLFLLGGCAGAVVSAAWSRLASVGASGAVFALLGALVVFAAARRRAIPASLRRVLLGGVLVWLAVGLWQGDSEGVDHAAHLGGLAAGALLSLAFGADLPVFSLAPRPAPRPLRVAAVASALVALLGLALALRGLVEGPEPARPVLRRLALGDAVVPVPEGWPHGRMSGACHEDPTPVEDLLRTGGVVCFRDPYGTMYLVGRASDVLGGITVDPLLTVEHGLGVPLRTVEGDVVKRTLPIARRWAVALVGYAVVERRYDEFLEEVVRNLGLAPNWPASRSSVSGRVP